MHTYVRPGMTVFEKQFAQSINGYFWDEEGAEGGTGVVIPDPNAAAGADQHATNPQPDTQGRRPAEQNTAEAERNRGILADLQRERRQRQELATERETLRAQLAAEQRRVQALAGVVPQSEDETQNAAIRAQFAKIFPGLAKLTDEQIAKVLATAERGDNLDAATNHHWQTHSRNMLGQLSTELGDAIGGEPTERQSRAVAQAFANLCEADPEILARYEAGDPKLIKEFVAQWKEDWYDTARRQVTADTMNRQRRVPNGRDRSAVGTGSQKKVDFNNPKAVEDAMVEAFKSHGGGFGE